MKLFCPKCKAKLGVDADIVGNVECPSCAEIIDVTALRTSTCPICGCAFEETDEIRICPDCKVPHHDECWSENKGCSTYGCKSTAHQETHTGVDTGVGNNAGMVPCPACGAMHPASDLVCGVCGKLLGKDLPGDLTGARFKESVNRLGNVAKTKLWPRLSRNFRLLGRDVATVFWLWWGVFSKYVQFSGTTTRREYFSFYLVNEVVKRLFAVCGAQPLVVLVSLVVLLPTLAATVRRLRDTDISPWFIFAFPILPFLLLVPSVNSDEMAQKTKENAL